LGILKKLIHSTKLKSFQNKNKAVFDCMVEHGFLLPEIRKSMMVLNGIRLADLSDGRSIVTVSNTIKGRRRNGAVMAGLATKLDLSIEQLFSENR